MKIEEMIQLANIIREAVKALNDLNMKASDAGLSVHYELNHDCYMVGEVPHITVDVSTRL